MKLPIGNGKILYALGLNKERAERVFGPIQSEIELEEMPSTAYTRWKGLPFHGPTCGA
jgi:hypothetical protein